VSWLFSSHGLDKHVSRNVFSRPLLRGRSDTITAALVRSLLRWVQVVWDAKMHIMKADGAVVEYN